MGNQNLKARRQNATPRGVAVAYDIYADRAENATIWDVEGREYTDFAGGIAVLNTGHRHPAVVAAVQAQLERFTHTAYQIVPYESYVSLAERVSELVPISGDRKAAFFTTGAEAVENAIKIARSYTGRSGVIAFTGGFHGRTMMTMALTGKVAPYKLTFGPMPGEVFHVPFPNRTQNITVADSLKILELLFKADIDPARVAAIIVEPVQGEGGFNPVPDELFSALRRICDEHGIVLIADEVQTGFARTGKWFASAHFSAEPDLITMAKSLAGGLPLSGVAGRAEIMDAPGPGGLGGTYAGNPLAVAAAHAVIDTIEAEKLNQRAVDLGARLTARLQALRARVPEITDVRGLGSMVAAEFTDTETGKPAPELVARIRAAAQANGLLLLNCGVYGNVLRFLYPLTIPDAQFDAGLDTLEAAITASVGTTA